MRQPMKRPPVTGMLRGFSSFRLVFPLAIVLFSIGLNAVWAFDLGVAEVSMASIRSRRRYRYTVGLFLWLSRGVENAQDGSIREPIRENDRNCGIGPVFRDEKSHVFADGIGVFRVCVPALKRMDAYPHTGMCSLAPLFGDKAGRGLSRAQVRRDIS